MSETRLSQVLAAHPFVDVRPERPILVFRPPLDLDLSALPREATLILHGFRPDHAGWEARGYRVSTEAPEDFAGSVIVVPRAKAAARAMVAQAAGRPMVIDGQKTQGVESILKDLRARGSVSAPISKAHGKAFAVEVAPEAVRDWVARPQEVAGWITAPGLFSADGPDPGSQALAAALPESLSGTVADLGAGWGFLAHKILARPGVTALALVEAEAEALKAARQNITDPRASFHWADARTWESAPLDHVVMNPPFHEGRAADPALGRAFIAAAARRLKPSGQLWMVANRHLPYEATLGETFQEITPLPGPSAFKLYQARRPIGARPRR